VFLIGVAWERKSKPPRYPQRDRNAVPEWMKRQPIPKPQRPSKELVERVRERFERLRGAFARERPYCRTHRLGLFETAAQMTVVAGGARLTAAV
jgi:hypothetical protein